MSYQHRGTQPVLLSKNPLDPDSTDWIYFTYEEWLRPFESIVAHSAFATGAEVVTDSISIGNMYDEDGDMHTKVYAVQVKPLESSVEVVLTHRVTTETSTSPDQPRIDIDRTVVIPVEVL